MRVSDRKLVVAALLATAAILQMAIPVSSAFQLWPIRLTRHAARAPATSTQTPPIELVFEMNPDDLDQGDGGSHQTAPGVSPDREATLNGTLILEDLVNQFERNFNSLRASNLAGKTNSTSKTISSSKPATRSSTQEHSNRSAKYKQATDTAQDQAEPMTTPATATPLRDSNEFDQDELAATGDDETPGLDPDEDRHIQYDTIVANASLKLEDLERQPKQANETHPVTSLPLLLVSSASQAPKETPASGPARVEAALNSSRATSSSSQAQARSMSGPSSRMPQHSRAPYASYNLFDNQRHGSPASAQLQPSTIPSGVPSSLPAPQTALAESSSQSQRTTPLVANSSGVEELAGGISKISSSLLADNQNDEQMRQPMQTARNDTTPTTTTKPTTTPAPIKQVSLVDRLQAYLNSNNNNNNTGSLNQTNGDEIERVVSKLVPINELTELEPLPDTRKTPMSERQFGGGSHRGKNFYSQPVGEFGGYDQDDLQDSSRGSVLDENSLRSVVGELLAADEHAAGSSSMLPQMDTIEMLSNQIRNSDNSLAPGTSSNTMAIHQHRERSPPQHLAMSQPVNRGELNGGGGGSSQGTFAASLINVTAPMVLPLSASEAMEAALAAAQQQQSSSSSMHLSNQPMSGSASHSAHMHRATSQPQRSSFHAAAPARNAIYMRPPAAGANQLHKPTGGATPFPGHSASGFRSPLSQFQHQLHSISGLPTPSSYLNGLETAASALTTSTSTLASIDKLSLSSTPATPPTDTPTNKDSQAKANSTWQQPATTNGFITGTVVNTTLQPSSQDLLSAVTGVPTVVPAPPAAPASVSTQMIVGGGAPPPLADSQPNSAPPKRAFNLSRVEHISAECSNDLIRTVIVFNGTFKGIIYSSNYVRDPNCLYVNGTGKTRYDFSIRLNQCGTIGRQELHQPAGPDEVRRRDQVMWNSLSIQYNPMIEQEWDEHFRVSCEYGSDFWKTISFNPFNVETNTGAPVVFTVDPPQCQMEILKGHGMVGPRQEAVTGPVTVGDPLTLLIHMKSEKAGYDILVKNCVAHNGGQQRMQLIDSNGCVINERFISPFRGTYNDNELKHVTLYSYLKAFRFTGSPVLYLECEVHMCQSACPPQMCYWRRLSKRSLGNETSSDRLLGHDFELARHSNGSQLVERAGGTRSGRKLRSDEQRGQAGNGQGQLDSVSLFQALEVRQERLSDPDELQTTAAATSPRRARYRSHEDHSDPQQLVCYQRVEIFAFLFTAASIMLAAVSVAIGCCWRAAILRRAGADEAGAGKMQAHKRARNFLGPLRSPIAGADLYYSPMMSPASTSPSSVSSRSPPLISPVTPIGCKHLVCSSQGQSTASARKQIPGSSEAFSCLANGLHGHRGDERHKPRITQSQTSASHHSG